MSFTEEENEAINNEFKKVQEWQRESKLNDCLEEVYKAMAGEGEEEPTYPSLNPRSNKIKMQGRYDLSPQAMSRIEPPPQSIYTGFSDLPNGGQK